ncbi:hypothetical protein T484DRAFT_1795177 [Baffinella frigidus]|nr:hypothetical protein T484DRAFT_1795177 [Cryptophyta sp. CCMP2293]
MYLRSILLFAVAVGAMAAPVMHPKGAKKSSDSGKKARADMRTYFPEQEEQNMIANMEGDKGAWFELGGKRAARFARRRGALEDLEELEEELEEEEEERN